MDVHAVGSGGLVVLQLHLTSSSPHEQPPETSHLDARRRSPGSARVPRAGFGVPAETDFRASSETCGINYLERAMKFVAAGTPRPARETRALPRAGRRSPTRRALDARPRRPGSAPRPRAGFGCPPQTDFRPPSKNS